MRRMTNVVRPTVREQICALPCSFDVHGLPRRHRVLNSKKYQKIDMRIVIFALLVSAAAAYQAVSCRDGEKQ